MKIVAPGRVDLAGGTLDVPPLCFLVEDAITLNLAITLETEISLEEASQWGVSSPTQGYQGQPLGSLFEKTIQFLKIKQPYHIKISSKIPRASGLGGSSTLLVALVEAFLKIKQQQVSKQDLLQLVTVLEHRLLGKPAGTQDAIAAIHGGLSQITYNQGMPVRHQLSLPSFLQGDLYLAYSSVQHHSGLNNWGIIKAACQDDAHVLSTLKQLATNAHAMKAALTSDNAEAFFNTLKTEGQLRSLLADGLLPKNMAAFSRSLPEHSTSKICGAGGGGCMLLFGALPPEHVLTEMGNTHDLEIIKCRAQPHGSRSTPA